MVIVLHVIFLWHHLTSFIPDFCYKLPNIYAYTPQLCTWAISSNCNMMFQAVMYKYSELQVFWSSLTKYNIFGFIWANLHHINLEGGGQDFWTTWHLLLIRSHCGTVKWETLWRYNTLTWGEAAQEEHSKHNPNTNHSWGFVNRLPHQICNKQS